jgi:hypothetical protein
VLFQIEPLLMLDECFSVAGMMGAPDQNVVFRWQLVQLTALVFEVFHVLLMRRYRTGWMLRLELRWHNVQARVPLCCDLLLVKVALPPVPWHEDVQ